MYIKKYKIFYIFVEKTADLWYNLVRQTIEKRQKMKSKEKSSFDYKWIIISVCFLMVFTTLGFCNSIKGSFLKPVTEALGIDRFSYSFIDSIRYVTTTVINVFFGMLVAKFGARILIGVGFTALVASQVIFAFSTHILLFYVGGVLLGVGISFTTTTIVGYVINRWCREKKGTVMGAVLAASGLGGAVAAQVVTPIISNKGYQFAYIVIAIIIAAVGIIVVSLFKNQPHDFDADAIAETKKKAKSEWGGITISQAAKSWYFYGLVFVVFLSGIILQAANSVWQAHASDAGVDDTFVGIALSVGSLALAACKFITGFLNDKCGLRLTSTLCTVIGGVVIALLAFVNNTPLGYAFVMLYSVFVSLSFPLETVMLPIYAKDLFGERSFDHVLGILASANTAGCALGAPLLNLCYEYIGDYRVPFAVCAVLMLALAVMLQFIITSAEKCRKKTEQNTRSEQYV